MLCRICVYPHKYHVWMQSAAIEPISSGLRDFACISNANTKFPSCPSPLLPLPTPHRPHLTSEPLRTTTHHPTLLTHQSSPVYQYQPNPNPQYTSVQSIKMPFYTIGTLLGASSVMLGAFGAHGLKARISDPARLANWSTAAQYQVSFSLPNLPYHLYTTPSQKCSLALGYVG